ncbi:hypothetical protein LX36DRAFT_655004 [Colletotrichum falcatum]|nr:hypothetical protein LX36DRAFT_655004 [Colletotrichum falcatum]
MRTEPTAKRPPPLVMRDSTDDNSWPEIPPQPLPPPLSPLSRGRKPTRTTCHDCLKRMKDAWYWLRRTLVCMKSV